jgi:hypothetical protein
MAKIVSATLPTNCVHDHVAVAVHVHVHVHGIL